MLGDTHLPRGARSLPVECVRLLERAEAIVHTGDFTAAFVLSDLRRFAPVTAVHGNMDDAVLRATLPAQAETLVAGLRVGLVHDGGSAAGRHDRLRGRFPDCDVIAYGHSHMPEVARDERGWIVNPGSPTERRRAPEHMMIVIEGGEPHLVVLGA
ncbi:MAG TPA: YfcE family phosphodiesterase [Gaiellaceae bacterium]|nr:YfcE family phosphodiesterase [Gaiellaceae bacterium]